MFGYQTNEECAKLPAGEKELGRDPCIWIQGDLSDHNLCELKPIPVYATAWLVEQGTGLNLNLSCAVRSGNASSNLGHVSHEPPSRPSAGVLLSLGSATGNTPVHLGHTNLCLTKQSFCLLYLRSVLCLLVTLLFVISNKARSVGNRDRGH
jgi:hypothetical protein